MLKLASWNVNSLKVRLDHVLAWLDSSQVDVLGIQETKLVDEQFPAAVFIERGYHLAYAGQKTYNGVAVISRRPISDVVTDIPGLEDPQRRILAVTLGDLRLINLYVPNGAEVGTDKYEYKLNWLAHVTAYIEEQVHIYPRLVVMGDFNIAPEDRDVHDPVEWGEGILVSPLERQAWSKLLSTCLKDSFRLFPQEDNQFSWWDYRAAGFRRNRGLRIDHILLSEALAENCLASHIDRTPRTWERPSDHTPVWVELKN